MTDELKKCPFCGSEAELNFQELYGYFVSCPKCLARSRALMRKQNAIDAWNRRANNEI